jgi:vancomycin resistance protein VanW
MLLRRRLLPLGIRQELKHRWRQVQDGIHRTRFDSTAGALGRRARIGLTQPIMPSALYQNKLINITRGAALLDNNIIGAHRNWSFWHRIHRPNAANGFVPGRNLVNGRLVALSGGGLCQLSSMVYHLALLAGLTIVERHAHSLDIYEEDQRFTPLGADATVVWGFKDLRLHNPHPFPLSLRFRVEDGRLIGEIHSDADLMAHHVEFIQIPMKGPFVQVNTVVNNHLKDSTIYEQRRGLEVIA